MCKPPKNFNLSEILQLFRFVWCEEFPRVCFSPWKHRGYCLPFALFGYKNVGKFSQNIENSCKNIKKHQKEREKQQQQQQQQQKEENTKRDK